MDPVTISLALGALATGGALATNEMNRREARKNRAFQKHMSDTAVQRSVADYKAAGLNPALAYDRSASSPSGSIAQFNDAAAPGINSALRARELHQSLELSREQQRNVKANTDKAQVEGANAIMEGDLLRQEFIQRNLTNPIEKRSRNAAAELAELEIPAARNAAEFARRTGMLAPGISTARDAASILSSIIPKPRVNITRNFPTSRTTIIKPPTRR